MTPEMPSEQSIENAATIAGKTYRQNMIPSLVNCIHTASSICVVYAKFILNFRDLSFRPFNQLLEPIIYAIDFVYVFWQVFFSFALLILTFVPPNKYSISCAVVFLLVACVHCILSALVNQDVPWYRIYTVIFGTLSAVWSIFLVAVAIAKPSFSCYFLARVRASDATIRAAEQTINGVQHESRAAEPTKV